MGRIVVFCNEGSLRVYIIDQRGVSKVTNSLEGPMDDAWTARKTVNSSPSCSYAIHRVQRGPIVNMSLVVEGQVRHEGGTKHQTHPIRRQKQRTEV
jgi:hypothetical protein